MLVIFAYFLFAFSLAIPTQAADRMDLVHTKVTIESLWVSKSRGVLHVIDQGLVIKEIPVRFGFDPEGPKRWRGDGRTPEGIYRITGKNAASQFYLSLQIDYPNQKDRTFAAHYELDSGGDIFLHGLPNYRRYSEVHYLSEHWTEGCIAMSDEDIQFLYEYIALDTPIVISP